MIKQKTSLGKFINPTTNYFRINETLKINLFLKSNNLFKFMEKNQHTKLINKNIFSYEINSYNIRENISLNQKEIEIFSLINNVLEKNNKKTICRVAGGWVRDKVKNFFLFIYCKVNRKGKL